MNLDLLNDRRKRSWILTFFTSAYLSLHSLPVFYCLITQKNFVKTLNTDTFVSLHVTNVFLSHLILDLVLGFIFYAEHLKPLEGIFHHVFYILLLCVFKFLRMTNAFYMFIWCEIPTFILALGILFKEYKWKYGFKISFLLLRIYLFIYLSVQYLKQCENEVFFWSLYPPILISIMHVHWYLQLN